LYDSLGKSGVGKEAVTFCDTDSRGDCGVRSFTPGKAKALQRKMSQKAKDGFALLGMMLRQIGNAPQVFTEAKGEYYAIRFMERKSVVKHPHTTCRSNRSQRWSVRERP